MDFRNIACISEKCKGKNIIMSGAGGQLGGRIDIMKVKCSECGLTLMIIPMAKQYEYEISATTHEERVQKRIHEAKDKSELALAKEISRIKETGY